MTAPDPRLDEIQARTGRLLSTLAWAETPEERDEAENAVTADVAFLLAELRKAHESERAATLLISALTDPDDCHFDHHGGCQAHGYLDLQPGELCPQLEAKAWVHNAAVAAAKGDERG